MRDDTEVEPVHSIAGRAFLLRVWLAPNDGTRRAWVRDVDTGEVRVFVDMQELASWLESCID